MNSRPIAGILCAALFICSLAGPVFAEQKEAVPKDSKVTFNFVDVDLPVITKFISEITKKNFIFDERIKGKITIVAPSRLSIDDAYNLFTSVLELKGFTLVPSGINAYKIVPSVEAKQRSVKIETNGGTVNESYVARLIQLKSISADDALKYLQPMVSKDGHISAFGPGNLILVIDSGLNIDKILSLLSGIDQPSLSERPEMVTLKFANAETVAKILTEGMLRRTRPAGPTSVAEEARAVADARLNAVILFGDRGVREPMKALLALLDTPSPEAQGRINVFFLENADAVELAKVLEGIIKGAQPQRQATPGAAAQPSPFESAGAITVTADKATNSLVVVASPGDYQNLSQIIKQLDRRRRQVYVEALIVEASLDKLRDLGVKWRASATKGGQPVAIGGFGTIDQGTFQSVLQGLQGATLGGLGRFLNVPVTSVAADGTTTQSTLKVPGFAALFNLNDFRDAVNVLSSPQILTSDNKEAEILVGENVPFISKRERDITTTNTVLNSIERKDIGITLRLTPQVSEGDYVKLDLYQEISQLKGAESENVITTVGPSTTKRSTKTAVVVKDGQTVVIGGLMQETDEEKVNKLPLLGDIPLLGWAFKSKSVEKKKTNLLVFLTPHIVKDAERLDQITIDKKRDFSIAEQRFTADELLVKFKEGVPDREARDFVSGRGWTVLKVIEGLRVYHVRLPKGTDLDEAIRELSGLPQIQYAEPNYMLKLQ